jgi:hypothetical protein
LPGGWRDLPAGQEGTMNGQNVFTKDEVNLARFVFEQWLDKAKNQDDPRAYLVEELKRQAIGKQVPEGTAKDVCSFSITGGCVYALNEDFRIVWSRTLERMADAALTLR